MFLALPQLPIRAGNSGYTEGVLGRKAEGKRGTRSVRKIETGATRLESNYSLGMRD
jgi:hypothetical protein